MDGIASDQQAETARAVERFEERVRQSARPTSGTGGTSVPEAPAKPSGQTRVLGPGWLAGTLCADPEMRFVGAGKPMLKLRLAVVERVKDPESGIYRDEPPTFADVLVWGHQAENAMEALMRGDRVVVTGYWQEDRWFGRDETWHTRRTLTAQDIGPSLKFKQARVVRVQEGS